MEETKMMQELTSKLANTFSELHEMCLQKLKDLESQNFDASENSYGGTANLNSKQAAERVAKRPLTANGEHPSNGISNGKAKDGKGNAVGEKDKVIKKSKPGQNKPKSPVSSFVIFCREQREIIVKDFPNCTAVQVTKISSKCWNELSEEQKKPYFAKYVIEKKKYDEDLAKYFKEYPQEALKLKRDKNNSKKERKEKAKNSEHEKKLEVTREGPANDDQNEWTSNDEQI